MTVKQTKPERLFLFVDRADRELWLWERSEGEVEFQELRHYEIAVGMEGHRTPRGLYAINHRSRNPDWQIPESQWAIDAGLTPGKIVPADDPANPIISRWLGVTEPAGGIGIHGTRALESIGTAASHGCIRMRPSEIEDLYDLVPSKTTIFIR